MVALSDRQILMVHEVIHQLVEPNEGVRIGGREYLVYRHQNGQRAIEIGDTIWIAQNPNVSTPFATLARDGHKITWGMMKGQSGSWAQVLDGQVIIPIQSSPGSQGSDFGNSNGGFGGGLPPGF